MKQPRALKKALTVQLRPVFSELPSSAAYVAISVASIQRGVRSNTITKPRVLGLRRVGWLVRELDEWV